MSEHTRTIAYVRVLGGVDAVTDAGEVVGLPSVSQRRLLGLLALHAPRRLRSEWLADRLGISTGALRTTVARIRAVLGPDALVTVSTGYSLATGVDVDRFCDAVAEANGSSSRLEALAGALQLWTGPVLDEFSGEEWADGDIARLTEIHAGAVDDYAEELVAARRAAEAVALLEGQIALHPYRDRPRGLLIRALALDGRQADALRAFQAYRSLLAEEVGTEPSPDVVRIERRVATGWNGVEADTSEATPSMPVAMPLPPALAHRVGFVGRALERSALDAELEQAVEGGLRVVIVEGEAGIGKTTLMSEFAWSLTTAARATVLYGRCDEASVPLEPFRTLIGSCIDGAPLDLLVEHVARSGGELTRVCPRLARRVATAPPPTESDDVTERYLVFEAVADLLRRMSASRPLVVMIDDLQWADASALSLLRHLALALAGAPVLLVLSRRHPGEAEDAEVRAALAELERHGARRIELGGLAEPELAELVVAVSRAAPDERLRAISGKLREDTAGNPLYASQLVRHWMERPSAADGDGPPGPVALVAGEGVPPPLREVVWRRVQALGDDVVTVLQGAAVLGVEFHEDVLVDILDLEEPAVVEALNRAVAAGLLVDLRVPRRAMRFAHALVAHALYSEVGAATCARLHARAAVALEKRIDTVSADAAVQLARHCALAGLTADALQWSRRAGDDALAQLAPAEAARHYRVALAAADALGVPDAERADLLVRLGDAQHESGDPDAFDTLESGAMLAQRSGNRDALVRAALAADRGFMRLDERAVDHWAIVESAAAVVDPDDVQTRARLLALLAQCLVYTPERERRIALANEAEALAEAVGDATLTARTSPGIVTALWAPGTSPRRNRIAARGVVAADASGDPRLQFGAHVSAYVVAVEAGDAVVAAREFARSRATARMVGEPRLQWITGLYTTFDAMMAGRLEEAEALAVANLDLGIRINAPDAFTLFAAQFFVIGTFGGRHETLLPLVEQARRDNSGVLAFEIAHAIVCAEIGRADETSDTLVRAMRRGFGAIPSDNVWMTSVIGYAILAIELEDVDAAAQLLPIIEPFASEVAFNGITSQGPVAAYVGKLASMLERYDEAEEELRAALTTATAFGWTYHRATTLYALAQNAKRRRGALDGEAEAWIAEAAQLCRTGGFATWGRRVDALRAETGS